jgi:ATP-dependent DNA helicase RecG
VNQHDLYVALNANTDEDILRHFPVRYEDLTTTGLPHEPKDGERAVVKGQVNGLKAINVRGTSLIRFRLLVYGEKEVNVILYNQPFYLSKLGQGNELLFVLYYSEDRKAYIASSILDVDSYYVLSGLRPIYALPKAVSSSYFANYVKKILSFPKEASYVSSRLPKKYIEKYQLANEYDAYRYVHLPRNPKDLETGLRVFKYEEALAYSIRALLLRKKADQRKKQNLLPIDHAKINALVSHLPYKLTHDQLIAIREIVTDMEKEKVMYRLLQGDVGTGKTLVAFLALYANYLRGKQGVLMAPTFELASQHYANAKKLFDVYGVRVAFLAGNSLKAKEKASILKGLSDGSIDILISTHSAISDSVVFKGLGLSIIDEQQLFGVAQREELISKGEAVDLLMMSATPIPRTLSQIVNADLDVSTLETFPNGSRNVRTEVIRSTDPLLEKAIHQALDAKRQIFIVAPKIEEGERDTSSAEKVYLDISERFGKDQVQLLHGRIRKEDQERIYQDFLSGVKPILVSTTVIEVGIDVSSAGLLVVYDANCFGLSSLHQLRGRIGRSGAFALALLVYDGDDPDAKAKLDYLSKTNDGLLISQFDLRQRGSGSYSGEKQSGRSELSVCNFVTDFKIFECAKKDALEILSAPDLPENSSYLKTLDPEKSAFLA